MLICSFSNVVSDMMVIKIYKTNCIATYQVGLHCPFPQEYQLAQALLLLPVDLCHLSYQESHFHQKGLVSLAAQMCQVYLEVQEYLFLHLYQIDLHHQ